MRIGWIGIALVFGSTGCWPRTTTGGATPVSSFSIALGSTDSRGHHYRLRTLFDVNYCIPVNNAGFSEDCSHFAVASEDDGNRNSDIATIRTSPGEYAVAIRDGWQLEELTGDTRVAVSGAALLSPALQCVQVLDGKDTRVTYAFSVDGEPIQPGNGDLSIGIRIEHPEDPLCGRRRDAAGSGNNSAGVGGFGSPAGSGL